MTSIIDIQRLPESGPFPTLDPFLFCVWHYDDFPAGNERMEAPGVGNGADFNPKAPFRFYHGHKVPGFPQHPHRGFETLTTTITGLVDHTDSLGNAGRYGDGDLQWMTAGRGIVHGENFPLLKTSEPNPLRLFQIWLNLPRKSKMAPPTYVMHWAEQVPKVKQSDGAVVTVFAGSFGGARALPPPPDSWAADAANEVAVWLVELPPRASVTLPPAALGGAVNRRVYLYNDDGGVRVDEQAVAGRRFVTLRGDAATTLRNDDGARATAVLLLQGRPIGEPVVSRGPFVMNTNAEIMDTFIEYQRTQFGGWPWPEDAVIFPRDKGRFSKRDGVEEFPPPRPSAT